MEENRQEENKNVANPEWFVLRGKVDYPFLFKPQETNRGTQQYSINIIISKDDTDQMEKIDAKQAEAAALGTEKYGWSEDPGWDAKSSKEFRTVERDGDRERRTASGTSKGTMYEGCIYIKASSKYAPAAIVDAKKQQITDPKEIKSGDECAVVVRFYPYDASDGNGSGEKRPAGIGCGLVAVQKIADGQNAAVQPRFNIDDYFNVEG